MKRAILLTLLAVGCDRIPPSPVPKPPKEAHARYQGMAMGSSLVIEVFGMDQAACDQAVADARAEISRLETMMTDWKQDSPLMEINHNAGMKPVKVPDELFFLIQRSLQLSERTNGAFDITFAGAGKLWNWRSPDPQIPDDATVKASLANVGWRGVVIDEKTRTVYLSKPGMRIGLGAIAPGYAADRALDLISAKGIRDALVDMSGDIRVAGTRDGKPWPIGVRNPRGADNIAVLPVSNVGVSTSGDYERFFVKDGKRYCHIIDPRTGYPADRCRSVTVVAPNLAFADGLATGVFVLGPEEGMKLIEELDGVEGMIVAADGSMHVSTGLRR